MKSASSRPNGRPPKLTADQVRIMRRHREAGITADAVARLFGVARSTALRYLRGETKHHGRTAA